MQGTRSLFWRTFDRKCEHEVESPGRSVTFLQVKRLSSDDKLSKKHVTRPYTLRKLQCKVHPNEYIKIKHRDESLYHGV